MNRLNQVYEYEKAQSLFKKILDLYAKLAPTEKKGLEVEIERTKANNLSADEKFDEALVGFHQILKKVKPNSREAGELELNIAQTLLVQGKYYEAIKYFKKAIENFEKNGWKHHYANALAYNDLAFAYDYANTEKDMMPTFEKALEIWTKYYATDVDIVSVAYNDAVFSALEYGDRKKVSEFQGRFDAYMAHYQANKVLYKQNSPYSDSHARGMYHLSSLRYYNFIFDESKILYHIKEQEKVFASSPKPWVEKEKAILLSTYDAASHAFYMNNQSDKGLHYIKIIDQLAGDDKFYKMKASANRAMLFYHKKEFGQSLIHNQKALDYLQFLGFKSSYLTLLTLKAENMANLGQTESSKSALKEVFKAQLEKDIPLDKIKIRDFGEINNSSYINIFIHSGKAYRLIYEKNGKSMADLKVLRNMYQLAAEMFKDFYKKGFFNPDLERQLNYVKEGLMYTAIQTPADKIYLAQCINIIEDISSQHLWKQFLAKYSNNLNLSKELINKRNETVIEISDLNQKEGKSTNEKQRERDLNNKLDQIDQQIVKQYPSYEKFQSINFNIETLQKTLVYNRTVIKYYVCDISIYAVVITNNELKIKYLGESKRIEKVNKEYHSLISKIDFSYKSNAKYLHKMLIEPLGIGIQNDIVFIPENFLNFCPFETLIDQKEVPLALRRVVSYSNLLKFSQNIPLEKKTAFETFLIGFAPKYTNGIGVTRSENGQLIYTGNELRSIANIFRNSFLYIDENTTKSNFLKSLGKSNIHHLAMHSVVDEKDYEYSSLVFQNNEKLHFYELYALNFPSEMVVLSACNTGVGKYLSGEGLMSISRALNYAGVKSTVNSLWQVPDKETAELMSYFYEFLDENLPKDLALAKAKRKFVAQNPLKNHPYYWAGFILNGDVTALTPQSYLHYYLMVLGIILALLLVLYVRKRNQRSSKSSAAF